MSLRSANGSGGVAAWLGAVWGVQAASAIPPTPAKAEELPHFDQPNYEVAAETVPCPQGAVHKLGHRVRLCRCNFGYSGSLLWDVASRKYSGDCSPTPCPHNAERGAYVGTCRCKAPFRGSLVWRGEPEAHYSGHCELVPCPNGTEPTEPAECRCKGDYLGRLTWDYREQRFNGQCVPRHPCPEGLRGVAVSYRPGHIHRNIVVEGSCEPAPCPVHAARNSTTRLCECSKDFPGLLQWDASLGDYTGECGAQGPCVDHAVHLPVRVTQTHVRGGCTCVAGYAGGVTVWKHDGAQWHGSCELVPCPPGATRRESGGVCVCIDREAGITWSMSRQCYVGHCDDSSDVQVGLCGLDHPEHRNTTRTPPPPLSNKRRKRMPFSVFMLGFGAIAGGLGVLYVIVQACQHIPAEPVKTSARRIIAASDSLLGSGSYLALETESPTASQQGTDQDDIETESSRLSLDEQATRDA